MTAAAGFAADLSPAADFVIGGKPLGELVPPEAMLTGSPGGEQLLAAGAAVSDALVKRTMQGASTVTLQLVDYERAILRSGVFSLEDVLTFDGLDFTLVQFTKTGDQLQLIFEDSGVADLRQQRGTLAMKGLDLTTFAGQLVRAVPGLSFYGQADVTIPSKSSSTTMGRGMTDDPGEDSWTCLNRLATSAGVRCFCSGSVVYFGSDPWIANLPSLSPQPYPTLAEFTDAVQVIDFDWDLGKPLGTATVTAMTDLWGYSPGQAVRTKDMGPIAATTWLVFEMQRDFFHPQASITLQVPMTPQQLLNPNEATLSNV